MTLPTMLTILFQGQPVEKEQCDVLHVDLYNIISTCDKICLERTDTLLKVCIIGNFLSVINGDTCHLDSLECISEIDDLMLKYFYIEQVIYSSAEYGFVVAFDPENVGDKNFIVNNANTNILLEWCKEPKQQYCYSYQEYLLDNIWYFDSIIRYSDTLDRQGIHAKEVYITILEVHGYWALAVLDTFQFPDSAKNTFWIKWFDTVNKKIVGSPVLQF